MASYRRCDVRAVCVSSWCPSPIGQSSPGRIAHYLTCRQVDATLNGVGDRPQDRLLSAGQTEAVSALAFAEKARADAEHAVRAGSGWTRWFLGSYGVTTAIFISLVAVGGVAAYVGSWVAYGVIATWFGRREKVTWRGFDRLSGRCFAAWFLLQGAGCGLGFNLFSGVAAYWVPVALVISVPMFVGAWRASQR